MFFISWKKKKQVIRQVFFKFCLMSCDLFAFTFKSSESILYIHALFIHLNTFFKNNIYIYHNELAIAFGVRKKMKITKSTVLVFFISFQMSHISLDMMKYCNIRYSFKKCYLQVTVSAPNNRSNSLCRVYILSLIK